VRARKDDLADAGFGVIAVGFSPAEALAPLADHLGWTDPFCSDVDRLLYARLAIGRAPLVKVFNARTLRFYGQAAARGTRIRRPVEDLRQLGGDVLVVDGVARLLALPDSPDDRPPVDRLVDGARTLGVR
jgi:hypothetical protein